ncbi:hypothetical protein VRU48_05310 [Pedobacter sp. KR3-3]|uniref:HTH luxR-type domain-containing protein n=1 Tax=Pedobacter albus TaxID=3113905 RepID=A0ABU7I5C3_9SPHI|nr:hypothetical protein [Pedobacter sp. KR3-3]MEE1944516.1 hypothetical protein [Pedobacter sp. KR3-3]
MDSEKLILIGCDDTANLSFVLNGTKGCSFAYSVVSATRTSDLLRVANAMDPSLIILCFRDNQPVLDDLEVFLRPFTVPVICLISPAEAQTLTWNENRIVFAFGKEHIANQAYLSSRINSVFLLNQPHTLPAKSADTPEQAVARHEPDHNLSRYVLELDQKIEVLAKVKERIAELYPQVNDTTRAELTAIVNTIKQSAGNKKLWDDFKLYFEQTDPSFLLTLAQQYPSLTTIDLKYCCYLKMNMTNDDIRNLLGINQESVRTHKYRLKKKMALAKNQDLRSYLRTVNS